MASLSFAHLYTYVCVRVCMSECMLAKLLSLIPTKLLCFNKDSPVYDTNVQLSSLDKLAVDLFFFFSIVMVVSHYLV